MNSLIQALGLDVRILLAQFVNFSVLIFVLWRFAYQPIFKILEERRLKIAQGVKDSEDSAKKLTEAEEEKKEIIALARKEANEIIDEAKAKAEIRYQEIVNKAKGDLKLVIEDEKAKIVVSRNQAFAEIKKDAASLIALALEKILGEKIDAKKDAELIERIIKDLD